MKHTIVTKPETTHASLSAVRDKWRRLRPSSHRRRDKTALSWSSRIGRCASGITRHLTAEPSSHWNATIPGTALGLGGGHVMDTSWHQWVRDSAAVAKRGTKRRGNNSSRTHKRTRIHIRRATKTDTSFTFFTRSSAIAEGPRDASCQLKSCQLLRNSAETTYTTSPDQIDGMKLEI